MLGALPGVEQARVNLSTRRVTIRWRAIGTPPPLIESLSGIGYEAHLHDLTADATDGTLAELYNKTFGSDPPAAVLEGTNELLTDD